MNICYEITVIQQLLQGIGIVRITFLRFLRGFSDKLCHLVFLRIVKTLRTIADLIGDLRLCLVQHVTELVYDERSGILDIVNVEKLIQLYIDKHLLFAAYTKLLFNAVTKLTVQFI